MSSWIVRGLLAVLATLLVVATVPRSGDPPMRAADAPASPEPAMPPDRATTPAEHADPVTCRGLDDSGLSTTPARYPTRTAAEVLAGVSRDPSTKHLFNDLAGVRSGPLRDPRVPLCRPELIELATPMFVRKYPAAYGLWLVPVRFEELTLVTMFVGQDAEGMGYVGGNRGGDVPIPSEAVARAAGGGAGDPVVSAELVFASASCGSDMVTWRLVRRSGAAVYLVGEFPGAPPPGALLDESQVYFRPLGGRPASTLASLGAAC